MLHKEQYLASLNLLPSLLSRIKSTLKKIEKIRPKLKNNIRFGIYVKNYPINNSFYFSNHENLRGSRKAKNGWSQELVKDKVWGRI